MRREKSFCLCSAAGVDILTATTLCRLCFRHVDSSLISQISCPAVKSKQTKEFRYCRSTLGSGIRVAFLSSSEWSAESVAAAQSSNLIAMEHQLLISHGNEWTSCLNGVREIEAPCQ